MAEQKKDQELQRLMKQKIAASLAENKMVFGRIFAPDKNYDIIERNLEVGGRAAVMYMLDGFTDAGALQRTIQAICSVKEADMPADGKQFMERHLPYGEVGTLDNMEAVASAFLAGLPAFLLTDTPSA